MAGIARENVSRILNDWKRRKLVSRLSGYYCLENKAKLQNEAETVSLSRPGYRLAKAPLKACHEQG